MIKLSSNYLISKFFIYKMTFFYSDSNTIKITLVVEGPHGQVGSVEAYSSSIWLYKDRPISHLSPTRAGADVPRARAWSISKMSGRFRP